MDYQLIILMNKKELMAVDITEDGDCEAVSIDGNENMSYSSTDDFADFAQYICDAYNVDEIVELVEGGTIVNCGADTDSVVALLETLKGFKGIDAIDAKKLLPIIAQNRGILKKNSKTIVKLMGNCFAVKCDEDGIATVGKNMLTDGAIELDGSDFAFLYFYKSEGAGGISEEELAKFKHEMENVKAEAEDRIAAAEEAAEAEIAAMEAKYENILKEHAEYKRIVEAMEAKKKENSSKFANAGIGDVVKFGRYYQDNTGTKKDIEWQVLDVEAKRILIIAKNGLDVVQFDGSANEWAKCSLRNWLNVTFFKTAFSAEETKMIANTNTESSCSDKVFLLSVGEVNKYFANDNGRKCKATTYAKDNGAALDGGNCYWWLRSPGDYSNYAAIVRTDGSVYTDGYVVSDTYVCVRPALWINLES